MKKRILSVLLTLVMLISLVIAMSLGASAEETGHTHCVCGTTHKVVEDHTVEDKKTFTAVSTYDELVTAATEGGSVYLANDIELTSTITVAEGKILNLCLNGMKLSYAGSGEVSIFTVEGNATLNITDCGTTARAGYVEVDGDGDTLLWHEGTVYGTDDIPYDLIGGLITGGTGTVTSGTTRLGGAVYAQTGATVNLYGGSIAGNSAGYGGCIHGEGCTMNIYGGSIVGNIHGGIHLISDDSDEANIIDSSLNIHGGNIECNSHYGYSASEVFVGGTITMTGGTVIAESTRIAMEDGAGFTMTGGTVINNAQDGVAVSIADTWADLSGGTISAPNNGTAVYISIDPSYGHFGGDIRLSGAPVLEGAVADITVGNVKVNGVDIDLQNHIVLEGPLTGSTPYTVGAYLITWDTDEYGDLIYESIKIDENPTIDFTKGWSTHMGDADPAAYFINANTAEDAKQIAQVDGELWLATTYTVTTEDTNGETRGGSYRVDKTTAIAGETVTITLTPDEGYILYGIWITNNLATTRVNDTTYTFVMPERDVWLEIDYMMPNLSVTCGEDTYYAEDLIWAFDVAEGLSYEYDGAPVTIKVERDYTEDIESFYNGQLNIENSSYSSTPDIILDLNGKDIHFPETRWYCADIGMLQITGFDLTLTDTSSEGDGIIHALVTVDGGNSYGGEEVALDTEIDYDLIVEGGTYRGFMVYTSDKIKISGGTFLGMPQEVVDEMLEDIFSAHWATFIGTKGLLISNNGGFESEAEARAALNAIIADGYATHKDYEITAFSYNGDGTDTMYYAGFAANTVVGRSITKEETNNGSFDVKVGEDEVNAAVAGTTVTITATPAEGYEVDSITVVGAGDVTVDVNSDGTFTMPDYAITITVTFKKQSFTVTTVVTTGGTVTGAGTYEHGSVATLAAMPNSGYIFMGWFTDDTYQTPFNPTTPITESITVYAKFATAVAKIDKVENNGETTYTITYTDGTVESFVIKDGADGATGNGIESITTNKVDGVTTVIIKFTDSNMADVVFKINDGATGEKGDTGASGAAGMDGITPKLQINSETNMWEVSYDNGATWTSLNVKATGEKGDTGASGAAGMDGITPKLQINSETNMWEVSYDNGATWTSLNVKATGEKGDKGDAGAPGAKGDKGDTGAKGDAGEDGVGIEKIEKTSSEGNVDTYTITLTNGTTYTFTVTNGVNGADGKDGADGTNGVDGKDGTDGVNGVDGKDGKDGTNGVDGKDGKDGVDGQSPYIGENGNWWIGQTDTGVKAAAEDAKDGVIIIATTLGSVSLLSNMGLILWLLLKKKKVA